MPPHLQQRSSRLFLWTLGWCALVLWGCSPPPTSTNPQGGGGVPLGSHEIPPLAPQGDPARGSGTSSSGTSSGPSQAEVPKAPPGATRPDCKPRTIRTGKWRSLSFFDKRQMMECEILPAMQDLFSRYNKRYAGPGAFHCQTCHGEPGTGGEFDFSKPSHLYPLDPNNLPTEYDPNPRIAAAVRFMKYEVVPTMQKMLPTVPISCFSCHAEKK